MCFKWRLKICKRFKSNPHHTSQPLFKGTLKCKSQLSSIGRLQCRDYIYITRCSGRCLIMKKIRKVRKQVLPAQTLPRSTISGNTNHNFMGNSWHSWASFAGVIAPHATQWLILPVRRHINMVLKMPWSVFSLRDESGSQWEQVILEGGGDWIKLGSALPGCFVTGSEMSRKISQKMPRKREAPGLNILHKTRHRWAWNKSRENYETCVLSV